MDKYILVCKKCGNTIVGGTVPIAEDNGEYQKLCKTCPETKPDCSCLRGIRYIKRGPVMCLECEAKERQEDY